MEKIEIMRHKKPNCYYLIYDTMEKDFGKDNSSQTRRKR
jgi:hypothetical protein